MGEEVERRNAELEREVTGLRNSYWSERKARLAAEAQVEALRKALEPFAAVAKGVTDLSDEAIVDCDVSWDIPHGTDGVRWDHTVGDFRRAAQALSAPAEERGKASVDESAASLASELTDQQRPAPLELYEAELSDLLDELEALPTSGGAELMWSVVLSVGHWRCVAAYLAAALASSTPESSVEVPVGLQQMTEWRDEAVRQLLSIRMSRPTLDDLCHLSRLFDRNRREVDENVAWRINEWLKAQIADARGELPAAPAEARDA
jgi:hypothetical protein